MQLRIFSMIIRTSSLVCNAGSAWVVSAETFLVEVSQTSLVSRRFSVPSLLVEFLTTRNRVPCVFQ